MRSMTQLSNKSEEKLRSIKEELKNDPHLQRARRDSGVYLLHQRKYYARMMRVLKDAGYIREGEWGI